MVLAMRKIIENILMVFISTLITIFVIEMAMQFYVYGVAKRGKRFHPDVKLGWVLKPELSLKMRNANGELFLIETSEEGYRDIRKKVSIGNSKCIVLGDSFAFGEGVNIEDRFDAYLSDEFGQYCEFRNLGVPGYGTDQEYILFLQVLDKMKKGDVVILLTYANDFYDILRKRFSGRAKPWIQINNSLLKINPPEFGVMEVLRDKSYLLAFIFSKLERKQGEYDDRDVIYAAKLYKKIVEELKNESNERGARLYLAFHGLRNIERRHDAVINNAFDSLCGKDGIVCIPLDDDLKKASDVPYLDDGHWNQLGHQIVGESISRKLMKAKLER